MGQGYKVRLTARVRIEQAIAAAGTVAGAAEALGADLGLVQQVYDEMLGDELADDTDTPTPVVVHGTTTAKAAHQRAGTWPCQICEIEAESAKRARRAATVVRRRGVAAEPAAERAWVTSLGGQQ